ncbi:MAG: DUF975 family protein [Clostridiales bacterium]|nr:DUF975 family protein [Candidatus Cacconaster stercorequi]
MTRQEIKERARAQLGNKLFGYTWMMALLACFIFTAITGAAASVIVGIGALIVVGPLTYGLNYMFLKQAREGQPMELGDLFKGFTDDFGGTLLIGLMTTIFTMLWSLLLIVPGIVKGLGYSMATYIKADYPEYDWKQCIEQSQNMMRGHKGELFMLYLSFIGWLLVGALCAGIGTLWVVPYIQASEAQFYESIKSYVIG